MTRLSCLLLVVAVAFACSGCTESSTSVNATEIVVPEGGKLVKLSVPNMVCNGCASDVRTDLAKIESVSNIQTDVATKMVTFVVDEQVDYRTDVAKYAESNSHLAEYEEL